MHLVAAPMHGPDPAPGTARLEVSMARKQRLFDAGYVIRTPPAMHAMRVAHVSEWSLLERHECGDFGCVSPIQRLINRRRIRSRGCVVSVYRLAQHVVRVVTDLDARTTTVSTTQETAAA